MKFIIDNKIPFIKGRLEAASGGNAGCRPEVMYVSPDEITAECVNDADAVIVRTRTRCDERLLGNSGVRLVVTATIGTDHIDIPWCRENGIAVRNAAGCNAPGVAQYVWASLLRLGFDPFLHTLGVVGFGHVGSIVAEWGRLMGARIIVCDPPRQEAGFRDNDYLSLEETLRGADAVTLHTPLEKAGIHPTFHMIGTRELELMRPGAVLVNSSRGAVVDNRAWASHLEANAGRGVADVWEGEPEIIPSLLQKVEIATPHIAGYSFEGKQRATRMAIEAVEDFFGISVPKDGLCGDYRSPGVNDPEMMARGIVESYDPYADDRALRSHPEEFERLRGDYRYRHEPFLATPAHNQQ